jgi:recombination protein RecA
MYNEGISKAGDLIDLASSKGIIEKAGAWYSYKGEKIAQGREAAKTYLNENPKIQADIAAAVIGAEKV